MIDRFHFSFSFNWSDVDYSTFQDRRVPTFALDSFAHRNRHLPRRRASATVRKVATLAGR